MLDDQNEEMVKEEKQKISAEDRNYFSAYYKRKADELSFGAGKEPKKRNF